MIMIGRGRERDQAKSYQLHTSNNKEIDESDEIVATPRRSKRLQHNLKDKDSYISA